ncbi:MAG: lamin tail domain-containing protein, partial [Roseibacillus sp.]|nr:lamin tail domain-containing protein [Roseibacillus sp.]
MRPITRYSGAALYLALACTTITSVPLRAQSLVIQEFMASNQDTINDEDGDNEDWIEIFNPGGAAINLDGWFLTDDAATLNKWAFPGIILSPGEQLLVFASNKNRNDPASELHTNFKLTSQGEYLALVRPDGSTVEHHYAPTFPLQVQDVSYGLQQSTSSSPLISPGVAMRYKVPVNGDDDVREGTNPNSWIGTEFPDSSWNSGTTGVGYATGSPDAYDPLIETDVQALMWTQRSSIYLRIPFTITDPSAISGLNLKMKWDDGFVVYLNGDPLPVAEENAPSPDQLDYQSSATSSHSDSQALVYDNYSLSSSLLCLLMCT